MMVQSLQEGSAAYLCPSIAIADYIVAINGQRERERERERERNREQMHLKNDCDA
jgi:hypothetical protein